MMNRLWARLLLLGCLSLGACSEPTVFPATDEEQAKKSVEIRKPTTGVPTPQVTDKNSDNAKAKDQKDSMTDPTNAKKTDSKSGQIK